MSERVSYVVEVRKVGASDWRPVKAYLSKHAAKNKAESAEWMGTVETRVVRCVPEENPDAT